MEEKKRGRPPKKIREEEFEKLCALQCTLEEISGWFDCHDDTIRNFCKKTYGTTFQEAWKTFSAKGRISLRRTQFRIAEDGNATMAIFLGKQYLGQTDRQDVQIGGESDLIFNISPASTKPPEKNEDDQS